MKSIWFMGAFALAFGAGGVSAAPPAAEKTVVIVANDQMKFSVTSFDAQPGQMIRVELRNEGTLPKAVMGHNWILLKVGDGADGYAAAAISAATEDYQPKALANQVIASIPLIGANTSATVTFHAPETPGKYAYLCSFPAHLQAGMRGTLVVR